MMKSLKELKDARPSLRRGYVLIVVLGLTAVVTTLGWAFLDAHSTAMPEAMNRHAATRAQYLAESGIAIGSHFLMYPPSTVSPGAYWTGAGGIAVDATSDYTNVSVVQDATDQSVYYVTALGVAHGDDGAIRGKHSITAKVAKPPPDTFTVPYVLLGRSNLTVPATTLCYGDVHAEGNLTGSGWCQSDVSATQTATWTGTGPPTSVTPNAPSYSAPWPTAASLASYTLKGSAYTAYSYLADSISDPNAQFLNAQDWSATNPGRVIHRLGNLRLRNNAQINGTLVVTGNLQIDGSNIRVTAVQNYPSLVVAGNIWFTSNGNTARFDGAVLSSGGINDNGKTVSMEVNGCCVMISGFNFAGVGDVVRLQWDSNQATLWDFTVADEYWPITVLSWDEN